MHVPSFAIPDRIPSQNMLKKVTPMSRAMKLPLLIVFGLLVTSCSALPGLRVLTGQDTDETNADQMAAAVDLVMADKTGESEPSLTAAADRIEAASGDIDIIEIRDNPEQRLFTVDMLFRPPNVDTSTLEGRAAQLDALRRAIELTWQGTMRDSVNSDVLQVRLLSPQMVDTLDHGESFVGVVVADASIERAAAAAYLSGNRSLSTFYDLIAQGTLSYTSPQQLELYDGQPNHPMFMLGSAGM